MEIIETHRSAHWTLKQVPLSTAAPIRKRKAAYRNDQIFAVQTPEQNPGRLTQGQGCCLLLLRSNLNEISVTDEGTALTARSRFVH